MIEGAPRDAYRGSDRWAGGPGFEIMTLGACRPDFFQSIPKDRDTCGGYTVILHGSQYASLSSKLPQFSLKCSNLISCVLYKKTIFHYFAQVDVLEQDLHPPLIDHPFEP